MNPDSSKLKAGALILLVRKESSPLAIAKDLLAIHRWAALKKGSLLVVLLFYSGITTVKHNKKNSYERRHRRGIESYV